MVVKRLIDSRRHRTVPESFGWVDHRLVRRQYIKQCRANALALYLFLVTVSDADGLSYYSDEKTSYLLSMTLAELTAARVELRRAGWILWDGAIYQVLPIDDGFGADAVERPAPQRGTCGSMKAMVDEVMKGIGHD